MNNVIALTERYFAALTDFGHILVRRCKMTCPWRWTTQNRIPIWWTSVFRNRN